MHIIIKGNTNQPLYEIVYEQVATQIITGKLPAQFCLPSIRGVALELSVSVITIKKAWDMLESHGYIYTIAAKGCYVISLSADKLKQKRIELAMTQLKGAIKLMKTLELSETEITSIIKSVY